jgi:hypothetical protein
MTASGAPHTALAVPSRLLMERSVGSQAGAQAVEFVVGDQLRNLRVDGIDRFSDRGRCGTTASGQTDLHSPAIHGIVSALKIFPKNEGVDQLAGHLLAQPHGGDDLRLGAELGLRLRMIQAGEHERAVAWDVVAPGAVEGSSYCVPVHVACFAHELRHWDILIPGSTTHLTWKAATDHRARQRLLDLAEHGESTPQASYFNF